MLRGCAKRNQTRSFKKILLLIIFVKFYENLRKDMLLKLILNLFSRRKRFKRAKMCLSCISILTSFFIRHPTALQGSSVKNRPLVIFVVYLNNVSINMLINCFYIYFLKTFE